ncbi:MAG: twin-arginine translocation signal domain-containing protein [Candidatus Acidiferrales bacterium]
MTKMKRRDFLKHTALAAAVLGLSDRAAADAPGVSIVIDPADSIASAGPSAWAAAQLESALTTRGVAVHRREHVDPSAGDFVILVAGAAAPAAQEILARLHLKVPDAPEALCLARASAPHAPPSAEPLVLACGSDVRGLVYALLELADRVSHASDPMDALAIRDPIIERPANSVRSIMRCFESDVEDKPWFYDRDMWQAYLSMLAAQRFNRFSLTLGLGYNLPRNLTDVYFYFPYPFLVSVPGYDVRAVPLPDAERDRNLDTLRFIGEEAARRGLDFRIGIWTHAYHWTTSPDANYTIEGLTPETHAAYCRDALTALLKACPEIGGVTFRIHGESGIPEGSYDFWQTVFDGAVRAGRRVEIDMHAKGMDQKTIDVALATGLPITISPKFWAEHLGLGYHQAAIHEMEYGSPPPASSQNPGSFFQTMSLSNGERRFLRYSYGDLLKENRPYGVLYRVWPGTQRTLLWGDPQIAADYGRRSRFCGGLGAEVFEPLSFKGRMGSGHPGGRCAYANHALDPEYDWQKYLYQYRLWGRLLYNPDSDPEIWRRALRHNFGAAALPAESALASASRILPLLLSAHGPSRSNNNYWPEMYTNMAIVDATRKNPYSDTPEPKRFGTVSPCDPQMFLGVDDYAAEILSSAPRSGKYSPLEVAQWMEDFALAAEKQLAQAEALAPGSGSSVQANLDFRRLSADVAIQADLGHFFACKFRSAVLWSIYDRTGDASALDAALKAYRTARNAWAAAAESASGLYVSDVSYGPDPQVRGHWLDRLPAIDDDIADMEKRAQQARSDAAIPPPSQQHSETARAAVSEVLSRPRRVQLPCRHTPSTNFHPGAPLAIALTVVNAAPSSLTVRLQYRHVNQAEHWAVAPMQFQAGRFVATIPGDYTQSPYPLQYYFELHSKTEGASLYPGLLPPSLSNQPYYVVRQA